MPCLAMPAIACVERKEVPRLIPRVQRAHVLNQHSVPPGRRPHLALHHYATAPVIHPSALTLPTPPYPCPLHPSSVIHHPSPSSLHNTTCLPNCTHSPTTTFLGFVFPPFTFLLYSRLARLDSLLNGSPRLPTLIRLYHSSLGSIVIVQRSVLGSASVFSLTVPLSLSHSLHTHTPASARPASSRVSFQPNHPSDRRDPPLAAPIKPTEPEPAHARHRDKIIPTGLLPRHQPLVRIRTITARLNSHCVNRMDTSIHSTTPYPSF